MRTPAAPTGCRSPRASTCRRRRVAAATCTTLGVDWVYLSPLLAAEAGSDHGYDVVDHAAIDPARGGAAGLAALSAEARRLGHGRAGRHRAQPRRRRRRPAGTAGGGTCSRHGRESAYAAAFDIDWEAGGGRLPHPGRRRRRPPPEAADREPRGRGGRAALPRPPLPDWLPARADDGDGRRRPCTPGSTTSWSAGGRRRRPQLPPVLRGQHARRDPGRGPASGSTLSHDEIRRWFDEGLVDGLRVDHPDGLRDPERLPRRPGRADRRRLRAGREDPRARRGAAGRLGDRRHHRATTRWR